MTDPHNADTIELPALENRSARPFEPNPSVVVMEFGALSDRGRVRPNNEDHYVVIGAAGGHCWRRICRRGICRKPMTRPMSWPWPTA